MKKFTAMIAVVMIIFGCAFPVTAGEEFNESEFSNAITISENSWSEFDFNSDLFIKIDVSKKNTMSVFEVKADGYSGTMHYYLFTKGSYMMRTQSNATHVPGYISVPHISSVDSGYIKFDYDSDYNQSLRNKTLKIRLRTASTSIAGWENATKISLNEENSVRFKSMDDSRWYKLIVPDEKFRYTFSIDASKNGCFIAELHTEEELSSGNGESSFSDCISMKPSTVTIDASMGQGTFYLHLYPISLYEDVLNTKFIFATDNKDSKELVKTSFGATVSTWAKDEIEQAYKNGIIPKQMQQADLTKKIKRDEFAAVVVAAYEEMTDRNVSESTNCHFNDITSEDTDFTKEIKKAYQIEAVQGISNTEYDVDGIINREQLATMLSRVYKKYLKNEWTIATDDKFDWDIDDVAKFVDDGDISDWAKSSVYFMVARKLMDGVGGNEFAPKNTTSDDFARGRADATKEQAIIVAQRMYNKKK